MIKGYQISYKDSESLVFIMFGYFSDYLIIKKVSSKTVSSRLFQSVIKTKTHLNKRLRPVILVFKRMGQYVACHGG